MSEGTVNRKLTTFLYANVAGYNPIIRYGRLNGGPLLAESVEEVL